MPDVTYKSSFFCIWIVLQSNGFDAAPFRSPPAQSSESRGKIEHMVLKDHLSNFADFDTGFAV
jgi:hypothetical protein